MSAYLIFSYYADIMLTAIVWSIFVIWYQYGSGYMTGFGKLLYGVTGTFVIYYTPWICINRYYPDSMTVVTSDWPLRISWSNSAILQGYRG